MISIQFIDFEPHRDISDGVEAQLAEMNTWLESRPDINVVNIETILLAKPKSKEDSYLEEYLELSDMNQVIRVWYEGEQ